MERCPNYIIFETEGVPFFSDVAVLPVKSCSARISPVTKEKTSDRCRPTNRESTSWVKTLLAGKPLCRSATATTAAADRCEFDSGNVFKLPAACSRWESKLSSETTARTGGQQLGRCLHRLDEESFNLDEHAADAWSILPISGLGRRLDSETRHSSRQ